MTPARLRIPRTTLRLSVLAIALLAFTGCAKKDGVTAPSVNPTTDAYTITRTLSDEAQRNTLAFDGLAFLTGANARYGGYLRSSLPPYWWSTDGAAVRDALSRLNSGLTLDAAH